MIGRPKLGAVTASRLNCHVRTRSFKELRSYDA